MKKIIVCLLGALLICLQTIDAVGVEVVAVKIAEDWLVIFNKTEPEVFGEDKFTLFAPDLGPVRMLPVDRIPSVNYYVYIGTNLLGTYRATDNGILDINLPFTGTNSVIVSSISTPLTESCQGDINGDNKVDALDFALFGQAWLQSVGSGSFNPAADFNGDGRMDALDFAIFGKSWLKGCAVSQAFVALAAPARYSPGEVKGEVRLVRTFIEEREAKPNAEPSRPEVTVFLELKKSDRRRFYMFDFGIDFNPKNFTVHELWRMIKKNYLEQASFDNQQGRIEGKVKFDRSQSGRIEIATFQGEVNRSSGVLLAAEVKDTISGQVVFSDKKVLISPVPQKGRLFKNYPDPCNERTGTWIPYQLAKSYGEVMVYIDLGRLSTRVLNLGNKPAGFYTEPKRAAYWDCRDKNGKPVPNGTYKYRFNAGPWFSASGEITILR